MTKLNISSDIVIKMIEEKYPLIMVDRIVAYESITGQLKAERYISANDPVFVGHFPEFKLWPGIHTIEGLRQSCVLYEALQNIETAGLLHGFEALRASGTHQARVDQELRQMTLEYLKAIPKVSSSVIQLRIKLIKPVYAGCKMIYIIRKSSLLPRSWKVTAEVNGRCVANGGYFI